MTYFLLLFDFYFKILKLFPDIDPLDALKLTSLYSIWVENITFEENVMKLVFRN